MSIVPQFDKERQQLQEGEALTLHKYCREFFSEKCIAHYKKINSVGFYECHASFTSFATRTSLGDNRVYTSINLTDQKPRYDRKTEVLKNKFSKDEFSRLVGIVEQNEQKIRNDVQRENEESSIILGIFHEIRRLSVDLDAAGTFFQKYTANEDETTTILVDNILQTIKLISVRVGSYELMKNPTTITSGLQPAITVYKKFDKIRYILTSRARNHHVFIEFSGSSTFSISGYEIFDLLPFIILDNAVKYSPDGEKVLVSFDDAQRIVVVKSVGPLLEATERERLFQKGFRGANTSSVQGSGLGLNMLKQICDLHRIGISIVASDDVRYIRNDLPYAFFEVRLRF